MKKKNYNLLNKSKILVFLQGQDKRKEGAERKS